RAQPAILPAITALSPTEPAPNTASTSAGPGLSTLMTAPAQVCTPQPRGPISSSGTSLRILTAFLAFASASEAKDDWAKKPPCSAPQPQRSVGLPSGRRPETLRRPNSTQ